MPRFAEKHPRRTFNGKLYRAHSWSMSKSSLKKQAREARGKGQLARVIKFGKAWALYVR